MENGNPKYDSRENSNGIVETTTNSLLVGCKNTIVPNSVTSIGGAAFSGCSSLISVIIPDGVTSIGNSAFSGCDLLASITIPNSVTNIGTYAFSGCSSLKSAIIGNGVTNIGNSTFSGCFSLESVTIGNSVTSIGDFAFYNCSSLKSVTIPNSVTSIGTYSFWGYTTNIDSVTVSCKDEEDFCQYVQRSDIYNIFYSSINTEAKHFVSIDGEEVTSVIIPGNASNIGDNAFYGCPSITSVTILDGVKKIGRSAFLDCSSLTSVTIPNSVTSVSSGAFSVFYLKSVTITIKDEKDLANYLQRTDIYNIFHKPLIMGKRFISIGGEKKTSITIPNNVTGIGDYALFGYETLTNVTIPNSVMSIGESAFYGCM